MGHALPLAPHGAVSGTPQGRLLLPRRRGKVVESQQPLTIFGAIVRDRHFHRIPFPLSRFEFTLASVFVAAVTTAPPRTLVRQPIMGPQVLFRRQCTAMNPLITAMNQTFPPLKQWAIPGYQRNFVWT